MDQATEDDMGGGCAKTVCFPTVYPNFWQVQFRKYVENYDFLKRGGSQVEAFYSKGSMFRCENMNWVPNSRKLQREYVPDSNGTRVCSQLWYCNR